MKVTSLTVRVQDPRDGGNRLGEPYLKGPAELRDTDVVKTPATTPRPQRPSAPVPLCARDESTRDRVARSILTNGPSSAAVLAERLELTPAAVRRHLDHLLDEGLVESREERVYGPRGRGRPAKVFVLTDTGRHAFHQAYDDLAATALRFIAEAGGERGGRGVRPAPGRRGGAAVPGAGRRRLPRATRRRCWPRRSPRTGTPPPRQQAGAGRAALPAPLPGRARGRAVPPVVRGRDRGLLAVARQARPETGHHRPRRRCLYYAYSWAYPGPPAVPSSMPLYPTANLRGLHDDANRSP